MYNHDNDDDDHNEMNNDDGDDDHENHDDEPASGIITASCDGVPARVKLHAVYVGCVTLES